MTREAKTTRGYQKPITSTVSTPTDDNIPGLTAFEIKCIQERHNPPTNYVTPGYDCRDKRKQRKS